MPSCRASRVSQKLEPEEEQVGGIRDYNIASQERIVRGRMPTMEIINERFARNIRIGLFNFIRKSPEVSVGGVRCKILGLPARDRGAHQLQHHVGEAAARLGPGGVRGPRWCSP